MTRETKKQKELRWAAEAQTAHEAYVASVPKRLMEAAALAQEVGVSTNITLSENGPQVRFRDENSHTDRTLGYDVDEWELETIETTLRELKDEKDARILRRSLADDVWKNKLTADERVAIKEFIYYLSLPTN